MRRNKVEKLVVHCSATKPDQNIGRDEINRWHKDRGWLMIGYHIVIRLDGAIEYGREYNQAGAHAVGHNHNSISICLIGGLDKNGNPADTFTFAQRQSLAEVLRGLQLLYPNAIILGHRDLSPDRNNDGVITQDEWLKECPCIDIRSELGDLNVELLRENKRRTSR